MSRGRGPGIAAAAVVLAALAPGCGLGEGESSEGVATLTVTRDYGDEVLLEASEPGPSESETVIRLLDREAEITTRYGGGFVQSIEGLAGGVDAGRRSDWFFFVNGIESPLGSAEVPVRGGDRIWWDHRDWTDAMRAPAVVGSWPEPFAQASSGEPEPVGVECRGPRAACDEVKAHLAEQGVEASGSEGGGAAGPRLLVGPWARVRSDPIAAQLDDGPQASGVFARFERAGSGFRLLALDPGAGVADEGGAGAGLVAALRRADEPPTWLVTGTDPAGVAEAARALDADRLAHRYALAVGPGGDQPLPAPGGGP